MVQEDVSALRKTEASLQTANRESAASWRSPMGGACAVELHRRCSSDGGPSSRCLRICSGCRERLWLHR